MKNKKQSDIIEERIIEERQELFNKLFEEHDEKIKEIRSHVAEEINKLFKFPEQGLLFKFQDKKVEEELDESLEIGSVPFIKAYPKAPKLTDKQREKNFKEVMEATKKWQKPSFEEQFPSITKKIIEDVTGKDIKKIEGWTYSHALIRGELVQECCVDKQRIQDFIDMMERTYVHRGDMSELGVRYCIQRLKQELGV